MTPSSPRVVCSSVQLSQLLVAGRLRCLLFSVVLVGVPAVGNAQERVDARTRLLEARSIQCQFQEGTEATWDAARPEIEKSEFGDDGVTFDSIDPEAGTARIIGNLGAADVTVMTNEIGLTFLEVSQTGNLMFTTVFASTVPGRRGHYIAVDSRHVGWPATWPELPEDETAPSPFPAQYHGTCTILE